jgi:transcriptional regulator with XRE-family HTH domain
MENKENFSFIFRKTRNRKKITLTQLSKKTGIDQGYLSRLERGEKSNPSSEVLAKLADALDVTTDYLLGRTDDPNAVVIQGIDVDLEVHLPKEKEPHHGGIKLTWHGVELTEQEAEVVASVLRALRKRKEEEAATSEGSFKEKKHA